MTDKKSELPSLEAQWEAIQAEAPSKPNGKPTAEELVVLRAQKTRIKNFLEPLTPEQRATFTGKGNKKKDLRQERVAQYKAKKKRNKNGTTAKNKAQAVVPVKPRKRTPPRRDPIVDYLLVLDFEATCNETGPAPKPQEIIEFPTLMVNARTGQVENEFHFYIKPDVHPTLSSFCTELTGITQGMVDAGISLNEVLVRHQEWLLESNTVPLSQAKPGMSKFLYVTCGDWDLLTCLPRQLQYHNKKPPAAFTQWINIKTAFKSFYGVKAGGMTHMLALLEMELEGRHHSGIDDCRNIARICARMLEDRWDPVPTSATK